MSWDEEWAALKRKAADGGGMQLASADGGSWRGGSGDGSGNLKSTKSVWSGAGRDVQGLRGDIKKSLTKLADEQQGAGGSGVQSAAAQQEVYHSWKRYLDALSGRCNAIQAQLEKAADHLEKNDQAVRRSFDGLSDRYEDTPGVGSRRGEK
ncbi:hypothetical protein [Streptomyces decoyicus]|uniref:hypothetical protein n=1 Tax=Streptomyces decoyicus TaxID=249567 RepID=UPI003865FB9A|nr:hypothetical protein OG532_21700 [Streptomyces decoyicus]